MSFFRSLFLFVNDPVCFQKKTVQNKTAMAHTILLVQPGSKPESRTYTDYESVNECMEVPTLCFILFLLRLTGSAILCRGSWFYKGCHGFNAQVFPVEINEINNGIGFTCHNNLIHGIQYLGAVMRIRIQDPVLFCALSPG